MLEIAKTHSQLSNHQHGPHFVLNHDEYLRETDDGAEVVELPLDKVVAYLDIDPRDPLRIEAISLICNNSGMTFHNGRWLNGERAIPILFTPHDGRAKEVDGGLRKDGQGHVFMSLHLMSVAVVLGHKEDFPGQENSFPTIQKHILEFIGQLGLTANLERIEGEMCRTCGKR